jgi:hypothetical protein
MDAFNRYFAPKKDGIQEQDISFSCEVDLMGTLMKMVNNRYIQGEDNVVHYYKGLTASNRDNRCYMSGDTHPQPSLHQVPLPDITFWCQTCITYRSLTLEHTTHTMDSTAFVMDSWVMSLST